LLDSFCIAGRHGDIASFLPGHFARIAGIEMILAAIALEHFALLGHLESLGD